MHGPIDRIVDSANADADWLAEALAKIALGLTDCGRPLAAEKARQIARKALIGSGRNWKR